MKNLLCGKFRNHDVARLPTKALPGSGGQSGPQARSTSPSATPEGVKVPGLRTPLKGLFRHSITPLIATCIVAVSLVAIDHASAAESFFKGRTVRLIVGNTPGGGFDTITRMIGRHLGKYLPGNPTVIVVNMPGAGSLVAANRVYAMQPGDGLTIVAFNFGLIAQALIGDSSVRFDPKKYIWLGDPSIGSLPEVLWIRSDLPIKSLEDLKKTKTPVPAGVTGISAPSSVATQFMRYLGYPIEVIYGYQGTSNVMTAMERKELDARFMAQAIMDGLYKRYVTGGLLRPILSLGEEPRVKPLQGIATVEDLELNPDQQRMFDFLVKTWKLLRLFAIPPGTPPERVQIIREAFAATLRDPQLLKEAERQQVVIAPASPETVAETIDALYQAPPNIIAQYKQIMTP